MDKTKELLLPALRQYRHSSGSGFLPGYDYGETLIVVSKLMVSLEEMKEALEYPIACPFYREKSEGVCLCSNKESDHTDHIRAKKAKEEAFEYREALKNIIKVTGPGSRPHGIAKRAINAE